MNVDTYRRAVGLEFRVRPCDGWERVRVLVRRHGGATTELDIPWEDAALLVRLSRWQTADECGSPVGALRDLVRANLAYVAPGARPSQDLSGAPPVAPGNGEVLRWRANAWLTPVISRAGNLEPFPFMPRTGDLKRAFMAGIHVGLMEVGQQATGVGVACCRRHGRMLREMVARLTAGLMTVDVHDEEEVRLVELLSGLGVLERGPALEPMGSPSPASITWLGHAAVLCELGGTRVLVDPLFHPISVPTRRSWQAPPDSRRLGRVDAVLITHGDNDHFNPAALCRLPSTTPVYYPRARPARPFHVDMPRVLELLGFSRTFGVSAWDTVDVLGAQARACPFPGEDWGLPLPKVTWLVQGAGTRVFFSADSLPDPDTYQRVRSEHGDVDVAFLGVGGCEESHVMPPGFGYGNFYAPHLPASVHNEWTRLCSGPPEAAQSARDLGARLAFGYAAGGAPYIPVAYTDRGTHAELAALLEVDANGPRPWALEPGVTRDIPPVSGIRGATSASPPSG